MARSESHQCSEARYEYRVWGLRTHVRNHLVSLAEATSRSSLEDCYFLTDEVGLNAKVRSDSLKIKQLVGCSRGFQRWRVSHHRSSGTAPEPFDDLAEDLRIQQAGKKGYDLARRVDRLDPDLPVRPVFVTKERTRHRIGAVRAEVMDITIVEAGEVLHTIAIEGDDLDALVALRTQLGLTGVDNVPVHEVIDGALSESD